MSSRSSRAWQPGVAVLASLLFLSAFFLGGLWLDAVQLDYHLFSIVDGLAALLVVYVLLNTAVLSWPRDAWGAVVLVYAAVATAQLISMLLPPPGLVQWIVLGLLIYFAWSAVFSVHRTRIVLSLGLVALALAALKYSVLPFVWSVTELPQTPILDLRALSESVRRLFAVYVPSHPMTQVFAFAAILAWVTGIWVGWPPEPEDDWIRRLSRSERDRLLLWLLSDGPGRGRKITASDVRGLLEDSEALEAPIRSVKDPS